MERRLDRHAQAEEIEGRRLRQEQVAEEAELRRINQAADGDLNRERIEEPEEEEEKGQLERDEEMGGANQFAQAHGTR